jgi:hypothetical protein
VATSRSLQDSNKEDTQAADNASPSEPRREPHHSSESKNSRAIARYWALAVALVGLLAGIAQIAGVSVTSLLSHPSLTSPSPSVAVIPSARGQSSPPGQRVVTPQASSPGLRPLSPPQWQPTFTMVQDALLQPYDLASTNGSFVATNVQPQSQSCERIPTHPLVSAARELINNATSYLAIAEQISLFSSIRSAQSAFTASSPHLGCGFSATKTDITDQVRGFCDQAVAVKYYAPTTNHMTGSYYLAELRCGRILLKLAIGTLKGMPADDVSNLLFSVETAIPKLRTLGQA